MALYQVNQEVVHPKLGCRLKSMIYNDILKDVKIKPIMFSLVHGINSNIFINYSTNIKMQLINWRWEKLMIKSIEIEIQGNVNFQV